MEALNPKEILVKGHQKTNLEMQGSAEPLKESSSSGFGQSPSAAAAQANSSRRPSSSQPSTSAADPAGHEISNAPPPATAVTVLSKEEAATQAVLKAREEARIKALTDTRRFILGALFYGLFLVIYTLVILLSQAGGEQVFYFGLGAKSRVLNIEQTDQNAVTFLSFQSILTHYDFWQWARGPLFRSLFDKEAKDELGRPALLGASRFLSAVRFRTLRARKNSCDVPPPYKSFNWTCIAAYSPDVEDTAPYGPGGAWTWRSAAAMPESATVSGQYATYAASGYVVDFDPSANASDIYAALTMMKEFRWTDEQTRAVVINFAAESEAIRTQVIVQIFFEFGRVGDIKPSASFTTVKFDSFIVEEILQIKKQGWRQFLQDQWNVINTINLCLFMAIIALRVTSINMYKDIMSKRPSPSVYIDYTAITAVVAQEYNLNAVNAITCYWKLLRYLDVIPALNNLLVTISKASSYMANFLVIFFITLAGFILAGYVSFGLDLYDFRDPASSFITLVRALTGDFQYIDLYDSNRFFGPIYYLLFYVLVFYILMNMFLAIIQRSHDEANRIKRAARFDFSFITGPIERAGKAIKDFFTPPPPQTKINEAAEDVANKEDGGSEVDKELAELKNAIARELKSLKDDVDADSKERGVDLNPAELSFVDVLVSAKLAEIEERALLRLSPHFLKRVDAEMTRIAATMEALTGRQAFGALRSAPVVGQA